MKFNGLKTTLLLGAMSGLLLALGQAFGGGNGLVIFRMRSTTPPT